VSERDLVRHLARFCGALRASRLPIDLGDEIAGAATLSIIDLGDRAELRRGLSTALRIQPRDRAAFDTLFDAWWGIGSVGETEAVHPSSPRARSGDLPARHRSAASEPSGAQGTAEDPRTTGVGYSPIALLRRKPFDTWSERDLLEMDRVLALLARRVATRRSRRLVPTTGRGVVDLRHSLRRTLATGGDPLVLARRTRPIERPRLVFLCDTSGSMDPHTQFLLTFALSLARVVRRLHVFAFNTELTYITPWLGRRSVRQALAQLRQGVPDWSGGTRIGACLDEFVRYHLPSMVDGRTVVVILSDGLDGGDAAVLGRAVAAIQRAARSVIWLNPLMGDARYEPTARGMAAALPFVDHFAAAHDAESLERIVPLLTV